MRFPAALVKKESAKTLSFGNERHSNNTKKKYGQ